MKFDQFISLIKDLNISENKPTSCFLICMDAFGIDQINQKQTFDNFKMIKRRIKLI